MNPPKAEVSLIQDADGKVRLRVSCTDRESKLPLEALLPELREFTNKVVRAAEEREAHAGRRISCKAGCGACCRQLVPLSLTEARALPALIESLAPEPRARVLNRFADAVAAIRAAGLWEQLAGLPDLDPQARLELGLAYFALGIACPFLEQEACSIHPDRPLICRQYLVTSDAVHCRQPSAQSITRIGLAANVAGAMMAIEPRPDGISAPVPLALALGWPVGEDDSMRTTPEWLRSLLDEIRRMREDHSAVMASANPPRDAAAD